MYNKVFHGDCLNLLQGFEAKTVDLIYLDPPFFSDKVQRLKTRDRKKEFSYDDLWGCHKKYTKFLFDGLVELRRVLKDRGSIFVHCDKNAAHIVRAILDDLFGQDNFRSEIIWHYRRWSSAKKGLLPAHQTIYFYSKSQEHTFNIIRNGYSESTNVDQILQKRARDEHGKAVYATDESGNVILDDEKEGVPLGDVWDIPYLNPKAKERAGYPTQKPILLLERIIKIASNQGDLVLDPFCGSGTTLIAAKLLKRRYIGIDSSEDAVQLTKDRLQHPIKSDSELLRKGRTSYETVDKEALTLLQGLEIIPVHRNKGIDAILKAHYKEAPVLIRIQKPGENLSDAIDLLATAAKKRGALKSFLIKTNSSLSLVEEHVPKCIDVIEAASLRIRELIENQLANASKKTSESADAYL